MPAVTGTLEDIGATSMASLNARVILYPDEVSTKGTVVMPTKEIVAVVGSGGAFSFTNVRASLENNPFTPYSLAIEWQDTAGNYTRTDFPGWKIVVPPAGGTLASMVSLVSPSKIVTKGDGATLEDIQSAVAALLPGELASNALVIAAGEQAVTAALAAQDILIGNQHRSPKTGINNRFRVVDSAGKVSLEVEPGGATKVGDTRLLPTGPFRVTDKDGYIALEVTPDGRTHIYDPAFTTGGDGGSGVVDTLHVFLVAGQSNASGRGKPFGGSLDPTDSRIFEYGAKVRTLRAASVPLDMHDNALGISLATFFAKDYLGMMPSNVGVLLVGAAHGATALTTAANTLTWMVGVASAPEYDLPTLAVAQTLEAIEAATAAGYTVVLNGVIWHQGEENNTTSTDTYRTRLDALIAFFRTQLASPKLPFVVGQMSKDGMDQTPTKYNVDKAHVDTPGKVANTGFAPSARLTNTGDIVHFSREGAAFLGKTFLAGYWQAVANIATAPPSAPVNLAATKTGTSVTVTWDAPPKSVDRAAAYDLHGAGLTYTWAAPDSHITAYKVEAKTGTGAWAEITRAWAMYLEETFTAAAGTTQVRVTALNGATASPIVTVTAVGA